MISFIMVKVVKVCAPQARFFLGPSFHTTVHTAVTHKYTAVDGSYIHIQLYDTTYRTTYRKSTTYYRYSHTIAACSRRRSHALLPVLPSPCASPLASDGDSENEAIMGGEARELSQSLAFSQLSESDDDQE